VKFGFEVDGALKLIVVEQHLNVTLESEGRGVGLVDDVEDGLLDGVVEPVDNTVINLAPLSRAMCQWWRGADMVADPKFAQNRFEETTPLVVVGLVEFEKDRDMQADVYRLEDGGGDRLRRVKVAV
jgi:hypothetical protein